MARNYGANRLPYTVEGLNAAVRLESKRFIWNPGMEPGAAEAAAAAVLAVKEAAVAARRKRDGIDNPIRFGTGRESQVDRDRDAIDRAKEQAAQQAAADARSKAASDAILRHKEETELVWYPDGQSINHGESKIKQDRAKARWAAKLGEKPVDVGPQWLPLHGVTASQLRGASLEQLKRWTRERIAAKLPASVDL